MPPATAAEQLTALTVPVTYGDLNDSTATGIPEFNGTSGLGLAQPQWGINLSLPPQSQVPTPLFQFPNGSLCGWSPTFEPTPLQNVPQLLSSTLTQPSSNVGHYDSWMRHHLEGVDGPYTSSPDGNTSFPLSGFPSTFAYHDQRNFLADAHTDLQSSIAPMPDIVQPIQSTVYMPNGTHMISGSVDNAGIDWSAITSGLSAILPFQDVDDPIYEPARLDQYQDQYSECKWVANGSRTYCGSAVLSDRRSVAEHLQQCHGIKPGEEKSRQPCLWGQCGKILNKESLARHVLTVHLKKERVHCVECGLRFARDDSLKRHMKGGQHKMQSNKRMARQ